ncbi:polysaccharide biosynthesis protein [Candidatus Pelagibacter sp.]|nr:polysaccharide biosynthesis protein [Candidatus Pelagibacter sp.]
MLKNKIIMITGGTGSFGSIAAKKFIKSSVKEIRIFSRDEKKQDDMRLSLKNKKLRFYIGDVRNFESVDYVTKDVDYIFHAAALKQVPSCEFYPLEAIKTNILGTENVMNAALKNKVKKMIVLSTDKAVYPINAMGISKAMMEKIMIAKARMCSKKNTIFCATRYGNVMNSRGSVIPLFINLIKTGKPITITDPKMTRFLMSLDESVDLVLHAFEFGKQGDIFVQRSSSATILDLAKSLKEIFSAKNSIKIIGTRHGEKLYESLLSREEMAIAKNIGKYYKIPMDDRDLNYEKYFSEGQRNISNYKDYTSHNTQKLNLISLKKLLLKLEVVKKAIQ